jgi:hypothetical protein
MVSDDDASNEVNKMGQEMRDGGYQDFRGGFRE